MWSTAFWKTTGESVLRVFIAAFLSMITVGTGIEHWPWLAALSVAGGAALVELGQSLLAVLSTGGPTGHVVINRALRKVRPIKRNPARPVRPAAAHVDHPAPAKRPPRKRAPRKTPKS